MNEYRQNAINHLKTHLGCVGYRDYLVAELEKLDKIEQITNKWISLEEKPNFCMMEIREILERK